MNIADLIQAISAGICFYAGISHLMIGLRSEPKDQVHLSFAVLSLLFGLYSASLFWLYAAFDTGSLSRYVLVDRWGLALNYLAYAAMFWFIGAYTGTKSRIVPLVLTGLYVLIAISNFILPYPWVYTDIELTAVFPPDIIVAPWYSVEQVITFLLTLLYSAYHVNRQFRRGEKSAARALGVAVGIFLFTLLWDYGIEYGLIDTVLMQQYGFVALIVIMGLRLSGQAVEAEKEVRRLNIELEDRVEERTAELSEAKESVEAAIKELQESETRLDHVLRSARLAVWEYDLQTRETAVTDMFPHLLGYDPNELLVESDKKWRGYQLGHQSLAAQLLHPDDKERYAQNLGEMIEGKETFEVEYRLRMANGQWTWIRDHGKIVKWDDSGKPLLAYGVVIDIDGMKNLQLALMDAKDAADEARSAAEAANRAKSVFLANMSHELRTPLNAILGFAQIMERDPSFPPKHRRNLETIDRSGEHLLDLINDVLEMSKIEAGRTNLEKTNFDLYNTLDSLESIMRVRAENKGLDLIFERNDDLPRYIRADERKLRQVLINLLGNAIKFTKEGQVTLRVGSREYEVGSKGHEVGTQSEEGETPNSLLPTPYSLLHFEVEDTGVGIDPQDVDRLFEPFSQTQSGLQVGEGTGLGLPISRQFVALMGGNVAVQSQVGQGSLFSFEILVELADPQEIPTEQPLQRIAGLAPGQPVSRILVVDDSAENRELLRQMLEAVGFDVRLAVDGREAVEEYQRWRPHLIWMDIRMPVMDGYQATKQIKEQAGASAPAVIAVTASAFEEQRTKVLEAGCDDFVRKPFTEAEIYDKMAKHLGVRYVYEELAPPGGKADSAPSRVVLEPADLADMPDDWLADLRQAATRGRTQQLLNLIEHIEPEHAEVAKALRVLADELEFKQIVVLTGTEEDYEQSPT